MSEKRNQPEPRNLTEKAGYYLCVRCHTHRPFDHLKLYEVKESIPGLIDSVDRALTCLDLTWCEAQTKREKSQ